MCITSPLTIFLSQRHGIRTTQFIGGVFLTVGVIATSLVQSINYMFLTYGVMVGIGAGLIAAPSLAIIPELFDKYVSIATGIAIAGTTFGLMFFSSVLPTLLQGLGWQKTLWILGSIGPLISLCAFTLPGSPVEPECGGTGTEEKPELEKESDEVEQPWWKSVKKKAFVLWFMVAFLFGLIEYVPLFLVVR